MIRIELLSLCSGSPNQDPPYSDFQARHYRLSSGFVFKRQRTGSVLCTSCGVLVGVNDETCYNCGRRNPALWGFAPALRSLGADLGFVPFVIGTCTVLYVLTLLASGNQINMSGLF